MKLSSNAVIIAFSAQSLSSPAVVSAGNSKAGKTIVLDGNSKAGKHSKVSKSSAFISYSHSMSIDTTNPPTSAQPTDAPSASPTFKPTDIPSTSPTDTPTASPTFPCNLTPGDERAAQIKELMSAVSDPSTFNNPESPQSKALEWITNQDTILPVLCPNEIGEGCSRGDTKNPMIQRYVMAVFYFGTGGDDWFDFSSAPVGGTSTDAWLGPVNECEWGGITCWGADRPNLNLCIDQLDFEDNGLAGTLPPEIGTSDSLRFLILEQGGISGQIPTEYGQLERLLILDMDFNQLSGTIPDEIYGLNSLQQLDLNNNQISGIISPRIGELQFLTFLQIDHNSLTGTIPNIMGELKNLRIAFMSDNELTGNMPPEVCALRNNTNPPEVLGVLVADCAEVTCPCCSSCADGSLAPALAMPINFTAADEAVRASNGTP